MDYSEYMYKEIWKGSGAKSYMRPGFLINEEMHEIVLIYEESFLAYIGSRSHLNVPLFLTV
jgi:hypothetical protein